jgi:uncharacterized protein YlxW (UPF0749 family)
MNLKEAQAHTGLSERTLREYIKQGRLQATLVGSGQNRHWEISTESLSEIARKSSAKTSGEASGKSRATTDDYRGSDGDHTDLRVLVASLQSQVETQERQLEGYERELEARRREVQELHVLLQQAQAALPAPRDHRPWWQRVWRRD